MNVSMKILIFLLALSATTEGGRKRCSSCKSVVDILQSMKNMMDVFNQEVCALKRQMHLNCSNGLQTDFDDYRCLIDSLHESITKKSHAKKNADSSQSRKGKEISNEIAAGFTPPPEEILHSENCPRGFEEVGKNCYKVYLSPRQWETFGDASEICKSNSGSALATPENQEELRQFLIKKNYAKRFWVGAKKVKKSGWKWLDGRDVDDWAPRNPTRNGSKRCIYWRPPNYKAVNHYCGEKFPFVCQKPI